MWARVGLGLGLGLAPDGGEHEHPRAACLRDLMRPGLAGGATGGMEIRDGAPGYRTARGSKGRRSRLRWVQGVRRSGDRGQGGLCKGAWVSDLCPRGVQGGSAWEARGQATARLACRGSPGCSLANQWTLSAQVMAFWAPSGVLYLGQTCGGESHGARGVWNERTWCWHEVM